MIYIIIGAILISFVYYFNKPSRTFKATEPFKFKPSDYRYTVYKSYRNNQPKRITPIFEGDVIDALGFEIYTRYADKLEEVDILIRDNQTRDLMRIVQDGDTESMIGVSHPEVGHIGYLMFEIVKL